MASLIDRMAEIIPARRDEVKRLATQHGDKVVGEVTVKQLLGGMRGIKALICDTSEVPPDKGLIIRGTPLAELTDRLPGEVFWLMCTGELPNESEIQWLRDQWSQRRAVPEYVWSVLEAMPKDSHPMTMLNTAILCMQRESVFSRKYAEGIRKEEYWKPTLDDALTLLARLPGVAAYVYRLRYDKGPRIPPRASDTWAGGFAHQLGLPDTGEDFAQLLRLYLVLHCDHEGGNVSAHAARCVGSALSDVYYSLSAGLNGLAGPLHGLANQECLGWILDLHRIFDGPPTAKQVEEHAWKTLNDGRVIPGYGHAVLRVVDPRFTSFMEFGAKHCSDDPIFQTVQRVFEVVPGVLQQLEKVSNPWPNVDAASGALLYHYGLREFDYYTVLFAVSRALGICAQLITRRAMLEPIERPKSVPMAWVSEFVASKTTV